VSNEEAVENTDPIKSFILDYLNIVRESPGDYFVAACALLIGLAIWKRMFRAAAGLLILILGVVLLRVLIDAMF